MRSFSITLVFIVTTYQALSLPEEDVVTAKEFFFDNGYTNRIFPDEASFEAALSLFRSDYGISATGSLREADMIVFKSPKCGNPFRPGQQIRQYSYKAKMTEKPFILEEKHLVYPTTIEKIKMRKLAEQKFLKEHGEDEVMTSNIELSGLLEPSKHNALDKCVMDTPKHTGKSSRRLMHGHDYHSIFQCYGTSHRPMTWCIENCLHNFCDLKGMGKVIQKAFDWWAAEVNLSFEEAPSGDCRNGNASADFVISFKCMDGPMNRLGFACVLSTEFFDVECPRPGYIFLDASEGNCSDGSSKWRLETKSCPFSCGHSYFSVITHEIGHVLGFEHEGNFDCGQSIMNPINRCVDEDVEITHCAKEQLLDCYDSSLCNAETVNRTAPDVTWCLANCLCNKGGSGFCNIQGMRKEINKAMQWWATRSRTVVSEICCDGGTGDFWKNDCRDIKTCLAADIVISFNNVLDGPGSELVRCCAYGAPLDTSIGCTQPGIIYFDSTEGSCPDGSSKWKLRTDECPSTTCPGSISFYHQLVRAIGKVIGFHDVPNVTNCTNSILSENDSCRTGQPILDSCLRAQIDARGGMKPFPEIN